MHHENVKVMKIIKTIFMLKLQASRYNIFINKEMNLIKTRLTR